MRKCIVKELFIDKLTLEIGKWTSLILKRKQIKATLSQIGSSFEFSPFFRIMSKPLADNQIVQHGNIAQPPLLKCHCGIFAKFILKNQGGNFSGSFIANCLLTFLFVFVSKE